MTQGIARKFLNKRRIVLLASVAAIGAAAVLGGPGSRLAAFAAPNDPVTVAPAPQAGFADLIAQVKPAVIAVRVKIEDRSQTTGTGRNDNGMPFENFGDNSPMEKFFRQFGMPNMPGQRSTPGHRRQMITGQGSGFFISPDGYAVTNYHVVDHAKTVDIQTDDGKTYTAKVVGTDRKTDLALIKVDGRGDFAYVTFAQKEPRVGDWVIAVGNPFGLSGTATAGIISARGRDIGSGPYDDFLQIDAPINKGNSGGPTFNAEGKVVGVNTAIFSPSGGSVGIGFAIPAETVTSVVAKLKDKGFVERGWIGVKIQAVTQDMASSLGMKTAQGAIVDEAQSDGPAAKAGMQTGDVITAVNGDAIKDSRELARKIGALSPGASVKLDIMRKGEAKTVTLMLGTMPREQQAKMSFGKDDETGHGLPQLGLTLAPAEAVAGAGSKGLVVTSIDPDSAAAEHGLQTGDVILEVGGQSVANVDQIRQALDTAKTQGKHAVLMRVKTGQGNRYVALPVGPA
jgi:serine protease Do